MNYDGDPAYEHFEFRESGMTIDNGDNLAGKKIWVAPEIRELDVRETSNRPGVGADVPGNPSPDCQRS